MFFLVSASCRSQTHTGELHLSVIDPAGRAVKSSIHLLSEANQYNASLTTGVDGHLIVPRLPYGIYRVEVSESGFTPDAETVRIQSALPTSMVVRLALAVVSQRVTVSPGATGLDPGQPGSVAQIGESTIQSRVSSIPGRSVQDLVNSQPGWLYEGNAVLHPRGSENQTQFVLDGIPLTDNRSPGFAT